MPNNELMENSSPKKYGRGLFLATLFGGLTSIAWGRPVWNRVNGALSGVEALVPLVPHGWRIYSVADTMPTFDPATWQWDPLESTCRHASLSIL